MAHKKAGGSTRNGRDSESKRLGVKRFGVNLFLQVTSSFVNVVLSSTQALTLVSVKTILFSLLLKVK